MTKGRSPKHYALEAKERIKFSDTIELNLKKPIDVPANWKTICASIIVSVIPTFVALILAVSGTKLVWEYALILLGNLPSPVEKLALDYSLTIFAGSAIFLLLYLRSMRETVNHLFNLKPVVPIDEKR